MPLHAFTGVQSRLSVEHMTAPIALGIVARPSARQRDIIAARPGRFSDADAIPDDLFDRDFRGDGDSGDETHIWILTDLGRDVRDLIEAEVAVTGAILSGEKRMPEARQPPPFWR